MCDDAPAIRRRRAGKGFVYLNARGGRVADPAVLGGGFVLEAAEMSRPSASTGLRAEEAAVLSLLRRS
jgi:hypothetical protein